MATPSLKEQCRSRSLKVGHFIVEFATPGIGHIMKNAGCDFVLFDTEHSGFGHETMKSALRYFEAAQLPAIVRVPSKEYHHIARAADMGAEGIMLPMVDSPDEARAILDCMKYVPKGHRGVALGVAHDNYSQGPVMEKLAALNERLCFVAQIETVGGVESCEEMAAIDGVDCLWVGHFDLSCAMGIPGQFDHPDFQAAVDRVAAACAKHGKACGRLVPDVATGVEFFGRGYDMICYAGDVWVLQAAIKSGVDGIRAGAAGGKSAAAKAAKPTAKKAGKPAKTGKGKKKAAKA